MTDGKDDALEWALKQWDDWVREIRSGDLSDLPRMQFESLLDGYVERVADERFDAGYQMAIEHCLRVCDIAAEEGAGIYTIKARIGVRAPRPLGSATAPASENTDLGSK